jgi:hypothetical protein
MQPESQKLLGRIQATPLDSSWCCLSTETRRPFHPIRAAAPPPPRVTEMISADNHLISADSAIPARLKLERCLHLQWNKAPGFIRSGRRARPPSATPCESRRYSTRAISSTAARSVRLREDAMNAQPSPGLSANLDRTSRPKAATAASAIQAAAWQPRDESRGKDGSARHATDRDRRLEHPARVQAEPAVRARLARLGIGDQQDGAAAKAGAP